MTESSSITSCKPSSRDVSTWTMTFPGSFGRDACAGWVRRGGGVGRSAEATAPGHFDARTAATRLAEYCPLFPPSDPAPPVHERTDADLGVRNPPALDAAGEGAFRPRSSGAGERLRRLLRSRVPVPPADEEPLDSTTRGPSVSMAPSYREAVA